MWWRGCTRVHAGALRRVEKTHVAVEQTLEWIINKLVLLLWTVVIDGERAGARLRMQMHTQQHDVQLHATAADSLTRCTPPAATVQHARRFLCFFPSNCIKSACAGVRRVRQSIDEACVVLCVVLVNYFDHHATPSRP